MTGKIVTNIDTVARMAGALSGIADGLNEQKYMDRLLNRAHGKASDAFNAAAAATAATGSFKHMYEFGTSGITAGPVRFPDPTSQSARLWTNEFVGSRGRYEGSFKYRPAINRNPQPTTKSTGVASKYLKKLSKRKYVFWNKALVVETGAQVKIGNIGERRFLFVSTPDNTKYPKGFVMWHTPSKGKIIARPGKTSRGTFTAFWETWWNGPGQKVMENHMIATTAANIRWAQVRANRMATAGGSLKPSRTINVYNESERARKKAKRDFLSNAINRGEDDDS